MTEGLLQTIVSKAFGSQSVAPGPAASASSQNAFEMQTLGLSLEQQDQRLWGGASPAGEAGVLELEN